jgi:uncharacterized membrane protein
MAGLAQVSIAAITFVGTHFVLSHPLRRPLVAAIGEGAFMGVYSVVAVASLAWLGLAYHAAPPGPPLWHVGNILWAAATIVMLLAAVLLMGSMIGNPAMANPGPVGQLPDAARGVLAVTRHPMNWSFALWGACHIAIYPVAANIILAVSIIVLALVGAALQDRKKETLQPERWRAWEAKTSYWPFQAIAAGRAGFGGFGWHTLGGGLVLWLVATWAHIPLSGWHAGIWRWIG